MFPLKLDRDDQIVGTHHIRRRLGPPSDCRWLLFEGYERVGPETGCCPGGLGVIAVAVEAGDGDRGIDGDCPRWTRNESVGQVGSSVPRDAQGIGSAHRRAHARLTGVQGERGDEHQMGDHGVIPGLREDCPTIGMADDHDGLGDLIDHGANTVGIAVEVDQRTRIGPVTREIDGDRLHALIGEAGDHPLPAPGAVPGTVYEDHDGGHGQTIPLAPNPRATGTPRPLLRRSVLPGYR